jgi:hypothetical protein
MEGKIKLAEQMILQRAKIRSTQQTQKSNVLNTEDHEWRMAVKVGADTLALLIILGTSLKMNRKRNLQQLPLAKLKAQPYIIGSSLGLLAFTYLTRASGWVESGRAVFTLAQPSWPSSSTGVGATVFWPLRSKSTSPIHTNKTTSLRMVNILKWYRAIVVPRNFMGELGIGASPWVGS